jgi:hypothetical protein
MIFFWHVAVTSTGTFDSSFFPFVFKNCRICFFCVVHEALEFYVDPYILLTLNFFFLKNGPMRVLHILTSTYLTIWGSWREYCRLS